MLHGTEKYFFKEGKKISRYKANLLPKHVLENSEKHLKKIRGKSRWKLPRYTRPDEPKINEEYAPELIPEASEETAPRRIFCRIFEKGAQANYTGLVDLGLAMESEITSNIVVAGNSNIPGGYTYLAQFIDHDITATPGDAELTVDGKVDPETILNNRTPSLDLDSLYGNGPNNADSAAMYESDKLRLKVGLTSDTPATAPGGPIVGGDPFDLPRNPDSSAIIGDGRNDENLAVAQTHVAFIKFHNKKIDELKKLGGIQDCDLFAAAREEVVLHYQSIVFTDFLPRIIEQGVLQDVIKHGRKFYTDDLMQCMPIEFSVAAFRLGHSMVRPSYEWNRIFNSNPGGVPATFELLFEFSGGSGTRTPDPADDPLFFGSPTLPSNWTVDWTRLYDFSSVAGTNSHPDLNFARELDTSLALTLQTLPEFQQIPEIAALPEEKKAILLSLATRNLLRGRLLELASGQQVANQMLAAGVNFTPITAQQIADTPHQAIVEANNFHKDTPLWFYILREAKIRHNGDFLGPVGSRIIAEVFVGLVENSKTNVFQKRPGLTFSMPELLAEVGDLNPLGS
ncbi:MAG: peroxidase [Gammaproteobacteria bacterium]|nr:peroxidase [Gammaproteobacteria bacterium]